MNQSESIAKLGAALVAAQTELQNPALDKTADTGKYKYRYASFPGVRNAIIPILARHGLAVVQKLGTGERGPTVTTTLIHSSGEWMDCGSLEVPVAAPSAQAWGGAITYARRYALQAVTGVVGEEDDDAAEASRPAPVKAATKTQTSTAKTTPAPTDPAEVVNQKQRDELGDLISRSNTDIAVFLRHFGIQGVGLLPLSRYAEARERLVIGGCLNLAKIDPAEFAADYNARDVWDIETAKLPDAAKAAKAKCPPKVKK